jgi:hypothetical protein
MIYTPVGTQNDVISTTARVAVVLGGAGTGKTITAAAAAAAHLRAADTAREQHRRTMIADGEVAALPPQARVLWERASTSHVTRRPIDGFTDRPWFNLGLGRQPERSDRMGGMAGRFRRVRAAHGYCVQILNSGEAVLARPSGGSPYASWIVRSRVKWFIRSP